MAGRIHDKIKAIEQWRDNLRENNKPGYLVLSGVVYGVSIVFIAYADFLLQPVFNNLQWASVMTVVLWLLGVGIMVAAFFFNKRTAKTKGYQMFWEPWMLVFALCCVIVSQNFRLLGVRSESRVPKTVYTPHLFTAEERRQIVWSMQREENKNGTDYRAKFFYGYRLFTIAGDEIIPFSGTPSDKLSVTWKSSSRIKDAATMSLVLPDFDIQFASLTTPSVKIRGFKVRLPFDSGARVIVSFDTDFSRYITNSFGLTAKGSAPTSQASLVANENRTVFRSGEFISFLKNCKIKWGEENVYGVDADAAVDRVQGGSTLRFLRACIIANKTELYENTAEEIRENTFYGGPGEGYKFRSATSVTGNIFEDAVLDFSSVPHGAEITNNSFNTASGIYSVGSVLKYSLVVKLVQLGPDSTMMLMGVDNYRVEAITTP